MLWHPFTQAKTASTPLCIVKGEGAYLIDEHGKGYLDLIASWWVTLHGHGHPVIARALHEQAQTLEQVIFANLTHPPANLLSQELCQLTKMDRVFFSDNGSTAVEIALKIALQYFWNHGEKQRNFFVNLEGGYHGDTFGAMAVGRTSGYYAPFESHLMPTFVIPYPKDEQHSLDVLEDLLKKHGNTMAALIVEPLIQGASGMRIYSAAFLQKIGEMAREKNILVIFDEVMTGFGRTGKMFAKDHIDFKPDLMCLSKGLTGGFLPMAATLTTETIYNAFLGDDFQTAFLHGHSYAGSPLGCAAGLASLSLFNDTTWENIVMIEKVHKERCNGRTFGTVGAFEVDSAQQAQDLQQKFLKEGLYLRPIGKTFYILPPYCLKENELNFAYDIIDHFCFA